MINRIIIDTKSSYEAVGLFRVIKDMGICFSKAKLNVNNFVTDSCYPEDWPLVLTGEINVECNDIIIEIAIHSLTCGYRGDGPKHLIEILKIAGFDHCFTEKEIFEKRHIEKLMYRS